MYSCFMRCRPIGSVIFGLALIMARPARAQSADNVLLVINQQSPASVQIGEDYASKRGIAADHIVRLQAVTNDTIERADFERTIESPIASWLVARRLQDRILYIVLTKGVPLRVAGTSGPDGTIASVDSELTLLYRKIVGQSVPVIGHVPNPYYLADKPITAAQPFTRINEDVYLVTRLDGFTIDDVLKLIDRGLAPSKDGTIVLDQKATLIDRGGDAWLQEASDRLVALKEGGRVVLETTKALATTVDPVLGYSSWGSNDPSNRLRRFGFTFANGAIAALFVSTDGRTFTEPPADWTPSNPNQPGPAFAGSDQTLAGDLIRDGVTGVAAHVAEPYLDATIRPQILFPAYLSGMNLAESFYLAMPYLSWQTLVVGDPLCAPFRTDVLTEDRLDKGLDADTDQPALFVERRLALAAPSGLNPQALKLIIRADGEVARGITTNVESLLTQATAIEPKLTGAQLQLASIYEKRQDYDDAITRYRTIVKLGPSNVVALNNLAYALAVRKNAPRDALPFAEQAYRLSNEAPVIGDTLGWIYHLLGNRDQARPLVARAAAALPKNPDVLLHAAVLDAETGDPAKAERELDAAVKLDPHEGDTPEAKFVREHLATAAH